MSTPFLQRRPLSEARALLLAGIAAVGDEEILIGDAGGRISAANVVARHPSPHYRASAMDGIALRSADTWAASDAPVQLRTLSPSDPEPAIGAPGCVPVDTGSVLPPWCDAVVRIEDTAASGDGYRVKSVVPPGADVRRAGEDIAEGTLLLPSGAAIRAWDIGAVLATGTTLVRVRRRPRVAILSTGSEVVEPVEAPLREAADALPGAAPRDEGAKAGQVIDSNSRVIARLVEEWGGEGHRLGIVADNEVALAAAIADAASRFDAVCVIAGSSAGRKDFTIATLASLGEVFAHGVDIAPGRPVALARLRRGNSSAVTPALAIPGYPVSAIVVCEQLLRPLVAALLGSAEVLPPTRWGRLTRKIPSRIGMEEFRRVALTRQLDGLPVIALLPGGAASISTVSGAHGWLRIAAAEEGLDAGTEVEIELMVPGEEVDAALVLAGSPCSASADLEHTLRRCHGHARVVHLRLGTNDVLAAVARGEAHAAFVDVLPPGSSLEIRSLPGITPRLAVIAGSAADRTLVAASRRGSGA